MAQSILHNEDDKRPLPYRVPAISSEEAYELDGPDAASEPVKVRSRLRVCAIIIALYVSQLVKSLGGKYQLASC